MMLTEIIEGEDAVEITFNRMTVRARKGDNVAIALLRAGHGEFREDQKTGSRRGPYCLMGTCFDCLVVVDGRRNTQACMTQVVAGMRVEFQERVK